MNKVNSSEVIRMYQDGMSMAEIGRQTHHPHGVIAYHIHRAGIARRRHNEQQIMDRSGVPTAEIIKLYEEGWTLIEMAERFHMTHQSVYSRLYKTGVKMRTIEESRKCAKARGRYVRPFGPDSPCWKGGSINENGYKILSINKKKILEHRYIWEQANGPIPDGWIIHHMNGDRLDNRLENLIALPRKQHSPKTIIEAYRKRIKQLEAEIKIIKNQKTLY